MAYQAMARRYRPSTFDEVVGQGHVARTLKNAISSGRVAHAYLFCGPHGCGKTSMARIFAKALNCTGGPSTELPADCPICNDITQGRDPDVQEIDGASNNSVDQVRTLREQAGYVPARARFKIYIIDEVHMLSQSAFNALLKTLEEPPPHVKFILATTEPHKLLETVLSRCQRFDFRLVSAPEMQTYLNSLCEKEGVAIESEALSAIAAFSGGSMRDGLVLLDQLISYCPNGIKREDVEQVRGVAGAEAIASVYEAIAAKDAAAALGVTTEAARRGISAGDYLDQLIEYGRDLLSLIVTKSDDTVSCYGPAREALGRLAQTINLETALLILDVFTTARVRVRSRALSNPLVPLEMAVARLAGLEGVSEAGKVLARIEELAASGTLSGGEDVVISPAVARPQSEAIQSTQNPPPQAEQPQRPFDAPAQGPTPAPAATQEPSANVQPEKAVEQTEPLTPESVTIESESASASGPQPKPQVQPVSQAQPEEQTQNFEPTPPVQPEHPEPPVYTATADADDDEYENEEDYSESAENFSAQSEAQNFGGLLSIEKIQEIWPQILDRVGEAYAPDRGYMQNTAPVGLEDRVIVLELPENGVFHKEFLEERERHERIAQNISAVLGQKVDFRLTVGIGNPAPRAIHSSAPRQAALQDPTVTKIIERFGCEVLNIE